MVSVSASELATATAKVRRRLIPFLFLLYVVAYLDRINVGFAALQMNRTLGFSASTYGLGAGIFFLSYTAFEVPSNVILARVGARLWIARIMITWGIVSSAMMLVGGAGSFYTARFLLGAAEAGFFPGIIYYLTRWFPSRERARAVAGFMTATLVAGIIGGPISGALLSLHGTGGLEGWQWLFLLEGVPAIVLGFVVLVMLPEQPDAVTWLTAAERAALTTAIRSELARDPGVHTVAAALRSRRVWLLAVVYFTIPVALYGLGFWLPQIIQAELPHGSELAIGLTSAVPYLFGAVGTVLAGRHSDRTGERRWHVAASAFLCGVALVASALVRGLTLSVLVFSLSMLGLAAMFGPFWTLATASVSGVGAAAAVALVNSVGNIGGFVGPYLLGEVRDLTRSFAIGFVCIGALMLAGGLLVLTLRADRA